jgi:hypothetical protein
MMDDDENEAERLAEALFKARLGETERRRQAEAARIREAQALLARADPGLLR